MELHPSISRLAAGVNALIVLGIISLAAVSGWSLEALRIGGPSYNAIIDGKDLVADILPPPLYVIEAFQEATDLRDAPGEIGARLKKLEALRASYRERHAYWTTSKLPLELRNMLTVDSDREANRFWTEIETNFVPALQAGDKARILQSFTRIRAAYDAHRAIVNELVEKANRNISSIESGAENRMSLVLLFVASATIASLYMAALAIRLVQTRVIGPLVGLANYMESGADGRTPFLDCKDEIGVLARGVAAFGSAVIARATEEQRAQLDAAMNSIVQAVEMYDADQRLVLSNARLDAIYNLEPASLRPGMKLSEAINLRVQTRQLSEEAAERLQGKIERALSSAEHREFNFYLADGRCILNCIQPLREGAGFVMTHQDVTEQRRSEEQIAYYAHHDSLTGLPNRLRLNDELEKALAYARRGEVVAVHILDLDNFKAVNDTLGHPVGDKLLKIVAQRLQAQLRDTDTIARMGGDEFAIVERQINTPVDAVALANRVLEAISEPYEIDDHTIVVGTSIGIAVGPRDGSTAEEIMRNADLALYRAKADGRGAFHFFEPEMDARMQERCQLERDLRSGVANGEFELFYQPVVNVDDSQICAFEALLRWRHPTRGLISPAMFIPLAEETRLIVPIGDWVLREACKAASQWPQRIKIAVNLSAAQFRSGNIHKSVASALEASGISADRLELEITESLLLDGSETTLNTLHELRSLGAKIAMDDFGTGYSSLSYLQSFPFDRIKIDKSFVQGLGDDPKSLNIVRAVTTLANGLGIQITAEGVESNAQLEAVRAEGCVEVQGFLMSKPLSHSDADTLVHFRQGSMGPPADKSAAA